MALVKADEQTRQGKLPPDAFEGEENLPAREGEAEEDLVPI